MGSYGIGLDRLMASIVEAWHDDKGIIWPETVAPFKIHLIEIKSANPDIKKDAEKTYKLLIDKGIDVLYDDRDDKSAGEKFMDSDLIGIPTRIVVSEKTLEKNSVEIKKRNQTETRLIKIQELLTKN